MRTLRHCWLQSSSSPTVNHERPETMQFVAAHSYQNIIMRDAEVAVRVKGWHFHVIITRSQVARVPSSSIL